MLAEAFLLGSMAAIGAGLAAANRRFSTRRVFERHKLQPIGEAKNSSIVHIRGIVRPGGGELLSAPLSGRPCVAWTLDVRAGHNRTNYVQVLDERKIRPFFVDEDHETAFVSPEVTRLSLIEDKVFNSGVDKRVEALVAYLADQDIDMLNGSNYIVREGILSEGEPVTVVGRGHWESDPMRSGEGYRNIGRRLVITNGPGGAVHVSDDPFLPKANSKTSRRSST